MPSNNPVIFNSVADRNTVYSTLEQKWSVVDKLYQGTDAMRAAGTELLPKGENEEQSVYNERLAESTLEPLYRQAVDLTADMIVSEDIIVNTSNQELRDFFEDVDGAGTDLTQFSESLLKLAIQYGVSYCVIDYPKADDEGNTRPFMSAINPRNVLGFDTVRIQGQEVLTDVRFFETVSKEDFLSTENSDTMVDLNEVQQGMFADQIRRYELDPATNTVKFTLYRRTKRDLNWRLHETGIMAGLSRIPMVPVYGNKDSYFIGTPLYYDAAMMNAKLWRTQSIQDFALKFNRYPAYIVTGIGGSARNSPDNPNDYNQDGEKSQTPTVKIPYGPGTVMGTPNTEVNILKFDGQAEALGLGFDDIDRTRVAIKENAPVLLLASAPGADVTATATAVQTAQASKGVKKLSRNYTNSLLQISAFVTAYYTVSELPTFEINSLVIGNDI